MERNCLGSFGTFFRNDILYVWNYFRFKPAMSEMSLKETKSATMNIFRFFFNFLFKSFVKVELSYVFTINLFTLAETERKSELSYRSRCNFLLLIIISVPPIIIDSLFQHKRCCFDTDNLLRLTKSVKCIPDFFYCVLKK